MRRSGLSQKYRSFRAPAQGLSEPRPCQLEASRCTTRPHHEHDNSQLDSGLALRGEIDTTQVFYGEFDPGSGRTLAACLTHASGATNQGLPWGRAANG